MDQTAGKTAEERPIDTSEEPQPINLEELPFEDLINRVKARARANREKERRDSPMADRPKPPKCRYLSTARGLTASRQLFYDRSFYWYACQMVDCGRPILIPVEDLDFIMTAKHFIVRVFCPACGAKHAFSYLGVEANDHDTTKPPELVLATAQEAIAALDVSMTGYINAMRARIVT